MTGLTGIAAEGLRAPNLSPESTLSRVLTTSSGFVRELFSSAPMPRAILQQARARVRIAALAFAAIWGFALFMNEGLVRLSGPLPAGALAWAPRQTWLTLAGFIVSLAVARVVGRMEKRPELAMDVGLALEVFNAFIGSFVIEFHPRTETLAVSWVCLSILLYPAIAPASTRKTFIAALLSASSVPAALLYAHLRINVGPQYIFPIRTCASQV